MNQQNMFILYKGELGTVWPSFCPAVLHRSTSLQLPALEEHYSLRVLDEGEVDSMVGFCIFSEVPVEYLSSWEPNRNFRLNRNPL